jgi:glycosyltransferase involved in cell wall biosynthesis
MKEGLAKREIAFVVPTLGQASTQDEDVVQLLVFAAARLEQELEMGAGQSFAAKVISVEHDTSGWRHLKSLFSDEALSLVSIEELQEPAVPNLAVASHKPAYDLFEFLKHCSLDEVHCLDRYGLAYYPTLAKRLGLYFLDTVFAVHVVGGTVFCKEAQDQLLDGVEALMDDLLERGSLERADVVYVHDNRAWRWYLDKIEAQGDTRVYDLAWAAADQPEVEPSPADRDTTLSIAYYGPLGADGGLPLFCDAVDRALREIDRPVEVLFVGQPRAIGGMDAVSYIRLRSARWHVPVTVHRRLAISEELDLIYRLAGIVYCNTERREGLRARLTAGSGLKTLPVGHRHTSQGKEGHGGQPAVPGQIAQALVEAIGTGRVSRPRLAPGLVDFWRRDRPHLAKLEDIPPSPPLKVLHRDTPKVTVCLTHFRRPLELRRALGSLKAQTYENLEVIVVDDGSPDPDVQRELEKIRRQIEPLGWRLLVQENRYLGAARNSGARHASGDYLMFMDDDNVAKPNEISTLVAVAKRTEADIVTAFCDTFESDEELEEDAPPSMRFTPFGPDPALGILSNCFGDANALYSRKVFEKLGGFTEDYGLTHEDWEFFCRASLAGTKMVCVPEPLFWYHVDEGGMFRGQRTQLHKSANLRRHIRPYLEMWPYSQAKLAQLVQGLTVELPLTTVGAATRAVALDRLRVGQEHKLPYARVAIIMRTKDRPLLLERAIRSVLDQTFKDWLLIIVNDGGSPEGVELVLNSCEEALDGRVLVVHHPLSLGMQNASNAGISACDSDFVAIHDDDDTWDPTFLARSVSYLDEHGWNPRLGGVVTWSQVLVETVGEDGAITEHSRFIFNDRLHAVSLRDLSVENRFPPISALVRRAALDTVGPFDERYGVLGDWDFHLRLLRRFDIDVIPEPLANYHHRTNRIGDAYANTVHAQRSLHQSKRVSLLNNSLREDLEGESGLSPAQLLALGDLQQALLDEQAREFERLHNYLWTIESRIKTVSSQLAHSSSPAGAWYAGGRNLARNGDFRAWPGPGEVEQGPGGRYAFLELCPGFLLSYDGRGVSYLIEQRKGEVFSERLPLGKTYLHIENHGRTRGGTWFVLECIIPSVLLLSGQSICVSGLGRMRCRHDWIYIGGRYILGDGRELAWTDRKVTMPTEFGRWSHCLSCPPIEEAEVSVGQQTRIVLKLPHNRPFEFDLTNFQVEFGTMPTEFEYSEALQVELRASPWGKARQLLSRVAERLQIGIL